MEVDEQTIREIHSAWIDAASAGDLNRLLALMTDDAVFLNPGQPPIGKDGFSANFLSAHEQFRIRCVSELQEVVVVGDVAYARAQDSLCVISRADVAETRLGGHRLTVYRKQRDGRWLLARDAHTLSPTE